MSHHRSDFIQVLKFGVEFVLLFFSFAEQQRENDRSLRKAGRDIERERRKLADEEKKIVSDKNLCSKMFKLFHQQMD